MQCAKMRLCSTLLLVLCALVPLSAQKDEKEKDSGKKKRAATTSNLPAVIWRDPGNIPSLNLLYGAGGQEHAPDPNGTYTFVSEDMAGSSPKFDVKDAQGVRWRVKLGHEPQSETAATRLVWAAGYFVDEDYYLPQIKVTGMPKLHRGKEFVSEDGTVQGPRLERKVKSVKKLSSWDWFHNPFLDKQEFNGLRIMMALVNNWDLKAINNSIYEVDGEQRYAVTDLGATFGKTGNSMGRSRSELHDYVESKFIEKETSEYVDFVMHSRPLFITAPLPYHHSRARMEQVTQHIPRADAKWLAQRLSQLSEDQIRDCFRAAGYTADEVDGYTKVVQKRISELNAL